MKIINKSIDEIKPYEHNTKVHTKKQIENVAESIRQYGFTQPIVIDKDGVIVIGHCRTLAAKKLGLKEIPCVCVDDLTAEQVAELRIVDNKTNESKWDIKKLNIEMPKIELKGFDFGNTLSFKTGEQKEEQHEKNLEYAQHRRANILNLDKGQFYSDNKYDFPELDPVYELPEIEEWIDFDYVLREEHPEHKAVHFFIDDYKFERIWNNPEKYVEKLKRFVCVTTPDFSPYGDMPLITQMFSHYKKHWVGAYLQEQGIKVIPTIRASTDPRSKEWYLDGEPHGGIVCISSMWTNTDEEKEIFKEEYGTMKKRLKPCKIFIYGKESEIMQGDNIERIPTFTESRFKNGKR